jgi:hypothetical protein
VLLKQWKQVLEDPVLRELPFRIETNKWGHIEMMPPASPRHMEIATAMVDVLRPLLGGAFTETSVLTEAGVKVVDLLWCSADYFPICASKASKSVLALPPSRYRTPTSDTPLGAGAREAWIVSRDLAISAYNARGKLSESSLGLSVETVAARTRTLLA